MIQQIIVLLMCISVCTSDVLGQWTSVAGGFGYGEVRDLHYSMTEHRLYVAGQMNYARQDSVVLNGVGYWDGQHWHAMGSGITHPNLGLVPPAQAVFVTDSSVVIAGQFQKVGEVLNTAAVAVWQAGAWGTAGLDSAAVYGTMPVRLDTLDGTLQLFGGFTWNFADTIENWAQQNASGWCQYDPLEPFEPFGGAACRFQGEVYAAGNFETLNGVYDVARQGSNGWEQLGPGLLGDPVVQDMLVFDDLLWVCGDYLAAAGNVASGLMAWDGSQWLNKFPQISMVAQCGDLLVANGKLYISGPFQVLGLPGIYRLAEYDGQDLCVFGGPDVVIGRIAVSTDTLYGQTCKYLHCLNQGPQVNFIAKWPLDAPADTCFAVAQGMEDLDAPLFTVRPNPTSNSIQITFSKVPFSHDWIVLTDMQGRELDRWRAANATAVLDLSGHAAGAYLLSLHDSEGHPLQQRTVILEP